MHVLVPQELEELLQLVAWLCTHEASPQLL